VPSVSIITLGCPKNEVDSECMASLLADSGYSLAPELNDADFIVVNTCGFVEAARAESIAELRNIAAQKRLGQKLIAAGCLPQLDPSLLLQQVPGLDALLGTRRWSDIVSLLRKLAASKEPLVWIGDGTLPTALPKRNPAGATAYVKIAEGCNGPCAFCTIPAIKGPLRSRSLHEIVHEVHDLVVRGYKEIILVAQDTTAYGRDLGMEDGLPSLIEAILSAAPSLPWLRIMYTYPQHVSDRLIEVMASYPQVCHYLDMPLQHAHPAVLKRMNRPSDIDAVLTLIERCRSAIPDIALRTTFIVGYPGETDKEFEALEDFVRRVRFDHVGAFAYSREHGTPAYDLQPQVDDRTKEERRSHLMALQQEVSLNINRSLLGRELEVLIEGSGDGISVGRTYRDAPEVDGLALLPGEFQANQFLRGRVTTAMEYDLLLQPVSEGSESRRRSHRNRRRH